MQVLETGNMTILVGLCMNYTAHVARGYTTSKKSDRLGRTKDMLTEMGQPIVSGAITTIGASVFMIPAQIHFNCEFGILMVSTTAVSFLFSLGFFAAVMGIIGPEGTLGCIRRYMDRVYIWWRGSDEKSK